MSALSNFKLRLVDVDLTAYSDALLQSILDSAEAIILARRFPFGSQSEMHLEDRYKDLQIRIAVDMFNRMGAEGQKTHSENSIQRQWENGWVSESLLNEIVPKVVVC